jgi:hypothetical protein
LALAVGVVGCGTNTGAPAAAAPTAAPTRDTGDPANHRGLAAGTMTLLGGQRASLATFGGRPLMVWFVAEGCASCEASIPAVAQHVVAFARAHVRVLVLGIYGAFGQGAGARAQLASFGRSTAGHRFSDPGWTWAVASAALTIAYDPGGAPDEYFLLDRAGRRVYQGSVPVSTMGALLAHLTKASA